MTGPRILQRPQDDPYEVNDDEPYQVADDPAVVAPTPTPGARRGIGDALGDFWHGFFPKETRRVVQAKPPTAQEAAASVRSQYGGRAPSDATGTPALTAVKTRTGAVTTQADADVQATRRSQQTISTEAMNSTPEHWGEVAKRGMDLGSKLHGEGRHEEAEDVLRKAYNAQLLAQGRKEADTFGAIALDNLFFGQAFGGQRRNIAEAAQPGATFTAREQMEMGTTGASPERGFDVSKDLVAPIAGQLPVIVAGGAVGRGVAAVAGAGLERAGVRGIGRALGRLAQPIENIASPASAGRSIGTFGELGTRIADEVATLRLNAPAIMGRGATEGQIVGGIQQYQMAREAGASPEQALTAVSEGIGISIPLGVLGEFGISAAGRAAHLGYDPIGRATKSIYENVRGRGFDEQPVRPEDRRGAFTPERRAGDTPLGPEPPERSALLGELGAGMEDVYATKREGRAEALSDVFAPVGERRPAGPEFWENVPPEEIPRSEAGNRPLGPDEQMGLIEPGSAYRTRPQPDAQPVPEPAGERLLRSQRAVGLERAGVRPTDGANAFHRMQQATTDAQAMDTMRQAEMDDPNVRLEQAAQQRPGEQQGPVTLKDTLAKTADDAKAGEPMAAEYHEAVNTYVDALAATKDLGEGKEPNTKQQITLARARQALNQVRERYGQQFGASAVLALAANDDDLTDEEKQMVGLGGLAVLSTAIVKHEPGGALVPKPEAMVSRLRVAIEDRQAFGKKWDEPKPAADWIGKLKGSNVFKKEELALLLPHLEAAQTGKMKLSRADVLNMANETLPRIERITLGRHDSATANDGDAESVLDMDDWADEDRTNPPFIQEQIANRESRIQEVEQQIEAEQERYADAMREAESEVDDVIRQLNERVDDAGLRPRVLDEALDYINERVEGEYVPAGVVDKAMSKISDDLMDARKSGKDLLESHGYSVEEEERPTVRLEWTDAEGIERREDYTLDPGETHDDAYKLLVEEMGEKAPAQDTITFEDHGTETEYIVRDANGTERGRDTDEDLAIERVTEEDGLEDSDFDTLYTDVKDLLNEYADKRSNYQQAESEHYFHTEGDAFEEENGEMETMREQVKALEDLHDEAVEFQADRALTADQTAQRRQLEAGGQTTMFPEEVGERPPGEPVAIVEAPEGARPEEPEQHIIPKVTGPAEFSSYQRIGGGTNYREMLNVWENKPGDAYTRGHYSKFVNTVGHIRAEDHVVHIGEADEAAAVGGEPEVVRTTKAHVVEKRKAREKLLAKMSEIVRKYEALPEEEQSNAHGLAGEYQTLNQQVIDLSKREDELLAQIRSIRRGLGHEVPEARTVAVMIESQSDWAQDANKAINREIEAGHTPEEARQRVFGEWKPPTPEKVAEMTQRLDRANEVSNAAQTRHTRTTEQLIDAERGIVGSINADNSALRERFFAAVNEAHANMSADEMRPLRGAIPTPSEILNPAWGPEWELLESLASPELRERIGEVRRLRMEFEETGRASSNGMHEVNRAAEAFRAANTQPSAYDRVPSSPFLDTAVVVSLNAARFLMDAAERGHSDIAWSDAANRVKNAHLPMQAARINYDELTPAAMKRLLGYVGFKDVTPKKLYIKGEGHWHIELTPAMRRAIRRSGLPILGLMALAGDAGAQTGDDQKKSSLNPYLTAMGGIAAGAALMALAKNRKMRGVMKENDALRNTLMMDDLSGLANKKAFTRAQAGVDADEKFHWVVFDGDRFKKMNDVHGHAEGDKAIQHFGASVRRVAEEMEIPMRGFRFGGDEIAFAAPAEHAAEFMRRVEEASSYSKGDVTTKLSGGRGDTFEVADAMLRVSKAMKQTVDPSLKRTPPIGTEIIVPRPLDLHANPIPQALRELARYPSAAALAGVGALLLESKDKDIHATGVPLFALAALSAIGARRLSEGGGMLADALLRQLQKSETGTSVARFFNPDALLTPEVKEAVARFEADRARAASRAAEFSRQGQALGPAGDRAASDVLEGEGWEDVSNMSPADLTAVLAFASALDAEYQKAAQELIQTGARDQSELLPNYGGPRRYAYYEAQAAQLESGPPSEVGGAPRIKSGKHRTLDEPIRAAEGVLREAQASGDPQAISDAQDALDAAKVEQMSKRVELGEIRESSYRSAQGIERAYADAAAARLFESVRNAPGVVHPEWSQASDDLSTARAMQKSAKTAADRDAARDLVNDALVRLNGITRQFQREGGDYVSLPDSRGLGKLRGAVVQRDVANTLVGFTRKGLYSKMLRAWKEVKTVFNPGTHQGNILSNISFAHMEGLHLWEQPVYLKRAAKDMRGYGPATRALSEAGILDVNAVSAEGEGVAAKDFRRTEGLEQLVATTRPETADVLRREGITEVGAQRKRRRARGKGALAGAALGAAKLYDDENPEDGALGALAGAGIGALVAGRGKALRTLYNNEDNIFRAAIWLKQVKAGRTPDEATAYTKNALGNFRSRSPALHMARSTVAPFILYPAKALPRFAKQVVDHPWRYVALMALWGGLNEYSEEKVGEVPESDLRLQDRRRAGYALPGFTQLPFANKRGDRAGVDIARWTPLSAATTSAPPGSVPASFDERLPDIFRAGGPVVDLAARFGANVDPYSGKPAYARDYPLHENAAALLNDVAGVALPSALDFHTERIKEDVEARDFDKLKNDALGPTGLRPRFVRPGANLRNSAYQLENSLREMKQDFRRSMTNNQNQARVPVLRDRYLNRVQQALVNFRERVGQEPPPDLVRAALAPEEP